VARSFVRGQYYSPNGKAIQDVSVTPSVQTTEAEPAVEAPDEDVQLRRRRRRYGGRKIRF